MMGSACKTSFVTVYVKDASTLIQPVRPANRDPSWKPCRTSI